MSTPASRQAPTIPDNSRTRSYTQAIAEAQHQLLTRYPDVFIIGQDVAGHGGAFGTTRGLVDKFGPLRVVDSPIAEKAIVALAAGSAATGLRPIAEIMFMDFIAECMDELVNQVAKMRYMFGGRLSLPVTVRTMAGGGVGAGAQHSQSLEAWLCHVPGLKVVMPATPFDAKGLLIAAVESDDPVVVIETKSMLGDVGPVPEDPYAIPLGVANTVRPGTNFTIIAMGSMVARAQQAADELIEEGIDVEVIDPRTLQPLDIEGLVASVRRTHRALVAHEAVRFGGLGAEIAAQIQEHAFGYLDAPIGRVGAPFCPVPATPSLEAAYMPGVQSIVDGVRKVTGMQV